MLVVAVRHGGSDKNPEKRLKEHNAGRQKYTKGRRPWVLHYTEKFETRKEAMQRERYFKTIEGYNYLKSRGII